MDLNNFSRRNLSIVQHSHYIALRVRTDHDRIIKGTVADIRTADDNRAVGGGDN